MDRNTHTTQMDDTFSRAALGYGSGSGGPNVLLQPDSPPSSSLATDRTGGSSVMEHEERVLPDTGLLLQIPPPDYHEGSSDKDPLDQVGGGSFQTNEAQHHAAKTLLHKKRLRESDVEEGGSSVVDPVQVAVLTNTRLSAKLYKVLVMPDMIYRYPYEEGQECKDFQMDLPTDHASSRIKEIVDFYTKNSGMRPCISNTGNIMLNLQFQGAVLDFLQTYMPRLQSLNELTRDSMYHILHSALKHKGTPDEVISELLSRVFGLMCVCWELISNEAVYNAQVREQERVIHELKTVSIDFTNALEANDEKLLKYKTPEIVRTLTDTLAKQISELTKVNSSILKQAEGMTKMSEEMALLTAKCTSNWEDLINSQREVIELKSQLATSVSDHDLSEKNSYIFYQKNLTLGEEIVTLRAEIELLKTRNADATTV